MTDAEKKQLRDSIRAKALSNNRRKTKVIDVFGAKVEVRQAALQDIIASANEEHKNHSLAYMMIKTCFVPGTDAPLFEQGDIDNLMQLPYDEDMQKISEVLTEFSGVKVTEAKKG